MKQNQHVGKWGEDTAVNYLTQKGCEILTPYGEIDFIVKQGDPTLFVGVETRTSNTMGLPEESITSRKSQDIIACAEHYAAENEIDDWQINVISIEGYPGTEPVITYF